MDKLAQMLTGVIPRNAEEVKSLDFTPLMKQESEDGEASTETADDCEVPIEGISDRRQLFLPSGDS